MRNQKGFVTADYLVAMVLVAGFSALILALSLSLSIVETVQYMTFASARNYYAGNSNPAAQLQAGEAKFRELASHPVVAPLFRAGWFRLETAGPITIGSISQSGSADFDQYRGEEERLNLFHGTAVSLSLKILDINIPLFGPTTIEENGQKKDFFTYIGSYLGRETTFEECENFMTQRARAIKNLPTPQGAPYANINANGPYIPSDNGC
jgi:hypothetical protein